MQIVDMSVKSAPTTTHTPGKTESGWENYGPRRHLGRSCLLPGPEGQAHRQQKWRKMTSQGGHGTCRSTEYGNDKRVCKAEHRAGRPQRNPEEGNAIHPTAGTTRDHQRLSGRPSCITQDGPDWPPAPPKTAPTACRYQQTAPNLGKKCIMNKHYLKELSNVMNFSVAKTAKNLFKNA